MGIIRYSFLLLIALFIIATSENFDPLNIGDPAPQVNHRVEDISGRTMTLSEVAGRNGLLVIFSCNTCPWVARWENRYNSLSSLAQSNGIGMIALNPNERIRDRGESMIDMRKRAQKQNYAFPYALDKDHILADAFGATRTPEVFLFDGDLKLVYHGAIDDNAANAAEVEDNYTVEAINALVSGQQIQNQVTNSLGCTIKRLQ